MSRFLRLWDLVGNQWRMSMDGPVGVDMGAVLAVADRVGCTLGTEELRMIRTVESAFAEAREKRDGDS